MGAGRPLLVRGDEAAAGSWSSGGGRRPAGMQALVLLAAPRWKHERMRGCSDEAGAGDGDPGEDSGGGAWRPRHGSFSLAEKRERGH